ncbi:hypothetical protein DU000_09010 [Parvibium lacunae]|uniref:Uncharacterized protein n=1 Tax=Parvibium lacunae TaxID=1888893 RepID=A0A368L1Y6_9BURK|nr:hypothetical protein DU000_09010 [Parvibium lacunae]
MLIPFRFDEFLRLNWCFPWQDYPITPCDQGRAIAQSLFNLQATVIFLRIRSVIDSAPQSMRHCNKIVSICNLANQPNLASMPEKIKQTIDFIEYLSIHINQALKIEGNKNILQCSKFTPTMMSLRLLHDPHQRNPVNLVPVATSAA